MSRLFLRCLSLGLLALPVSAAPIQLIEGLPSFYVPGQPIAFEVRLPQVTNLGSYNIDLALETAAGTAGVDFYFDVGATMPAAANYVFPSSANFFDVVNVDFATRHRITLTDFDFVGVNVAPGINDRVAHVFINTASSLAGHLSLFVDPDGLILDTPDINPTPIGGFDTLKSGVAASGPIMLGPVPEPSAAALLAWALWGGCTRRWTGRRVSEPNTA